tara:strand:- start:913 stop:1833 length:921 start_codon:yes stop_codon:yes gene_type:complete
MNIKKFYKFLQGVYYLNSKNKVLNFKDIVNIKKANKNRSNRSRICFHENINDTFQEMFISMNKNTFIQPSKHNYTETFMVIEGMSKYLFLNEKGNLVSDLRLGNYDSELPFILILPKNTLHSLLLVTSELLAFETISNRFVKENTFFPSWSKLFKKNIKKLYYSPVTRIKSAKFDKIGKNLYTLNKQYYYISRTDISSLIKNVSKKTNQISILLKKLKKNNFQESINIYFNKKKFELLKNEGKLSIFIIKGSGILNVYSEKNKFIKKIYLSDISSKGDCFIRFENKNSIMIKPFTEKLIIKSSSIS